jgi:hypothetical protein
MTPTREPFVVRQDPDRLAQRKLVLVVVTSILIAAIAITSAWLILAASSRGPAAATGKGAIPPPSGVGTVERTLIETTERGLTLRAEQREALEHYGWVDRDAGMARIPVERAMDIVAGRPVPANEALLP